MCACSQPPGHRPAEPVDACLVIGFDDGQRFAGALESSIEFLLLFLGNRFFNLACSHTLKALLA